MEARHAKLKEIAASAKKLHKRAKKAAKALKKLMEQAAEQEQAAGSPNPCPNPKNGQPTIERRSFSRHPSASFCDEVLVELHGGWQEARFVQETPAWVTVQVCATGEMGPQVPPFRGGFAVSW